MKKNLLVRNNWNHMFMPPPIGVGALNFTVVRLSVRTSTYIFVRLNSVTTYRNDLKFDMQPYHYELYHVCHFHETSCLPNLNLVCSSEKFSSAETQQLLMGFVLDLVYSLTIMISFVCINFIDLIYLCIY